MTLVWLGWVARKIREDLSGFFCFGDRESDRIGSAGLGGIWNFFGSKQRASARTEPACLQLRGGHNGSVTMSIDRRKFLKGSMLATTGALASPYIISSPVRAAGTVNVGVLFSLTGGLSIIEKSLHDATLMAISEINASGGAKGMKINAIVEDGASDPKTYNEKASKLVIQDRVPTVFGSYTSASRKAVLPVFEKRNNLYFYPTYYEGFECSKNVVYTGAVPNQQLSNFIPWIIKTLGKKKFFIVGSNYIYPREMAKVSKILIEKNGGEWIADEYLELGHSEWGSMVNKIKGSGCDVVLSNVVGDSVVAFYREYKNQGLTHDKLPICATVTSEIEIAAMGPEYAVGSYTSFPYFQAIDTDRNKAFVERYRAFVKDPKAVTHHALESSYFQVFLWKQAVEKAAEVTPTAIRDAVKGQEFDAPNGHVKIDPDNLHTYLTPRIAQWLPDGQGKIIDAYKEPTIPLPYVAYGETESNLFCTAKGLDTSKLKI
jgi:urea transport system substrate-binding protein